MLLGNLSFVACLPHLTHCLGTGSCPNHINHVPKVWALSYLFFSQPLSSLLLAARLANAQRQVDADMNAEAADSFKVAFLPTFLFIRNEKADCSDHNSAPCWAPRATDWLEAMYMLHVVYQNCCFAVPALQVHSRILRPKVPIQKPRIADLSQACA